MAKSSSVERNNKRKRMAKKFGAKRLALKETMMSKTSTIEERFEAQMKLAKLPRNSAEIRVRNRCEITGRPRGYLRKVKMSRIALRQLASLGQIPGMIKSSW